MMINATKDQMRSLRLQGMLEALEEMLESGATTNLSFEEALGLMVDREMAMRDNRRLQRRMKTAKLKLPAQIEDIDWRARRNLDKTVMLTLANCDWIKRKQNVIFVGPAGVGKTWLACALATKACTTGFTSKFLRFPRLFDEIREARIDGSLAKYMKSLAKTDVLVLDDWGHHLDADERRDLFEIIEDRNESSSTIITTQLPVDHWHAAIGEPTIADAICDRIVNRAHKIELDGHSLRLRDKPESLEKTTRKKRD